MSYLPNTQFSYGDGPALDAFGRLRVSNLFNIFDVKLVDGISDIFFDEKFSGGSLTELTGDSAHLLSVTGGSGSYAIVQTKRKFNYQSGKGQLAYFTGVLSIQIGTIKRIGLFDGSHIAPFLPYNGLYFETDGTDISVNMVKNTTGITKIIQSDWNLDKMDGSSGKTNPSGILLDTTKSQIFTIDFEWLGVGRVRYGLNIDGITYYVHEILNANNIYGVYIRYPNLPIRYEIRSTGGNGDILQICSAISSEGGFDPNGIIRNLRSSPAGFTIANNTPRPILAIRLRNIDNMIEIIPLFASVGNEGSGDFFWVLKYYDGNETINRNGTPTAWKDIAFTGLTSSSIEYKNNFLTTDTVIAGQGIEISSAVQIANSSGFFGGGGSIITNIKNALLIGSAIDGVADVLCLEIINVGTSDTYYATLNWREV